jgi:hypothetical protein
MRFLSDNKAKLKRTAAAALLVCLAAAVACTAGACAPDEGEKVQVTFADETLEAVVPPDETPSAQPTAEPTPLPTATPPEHPREVKKGTRGSDVQALKERLKQLGYYLSDEAMDEYGDKTAVAVSEFQRLIGWSRRARSCFRRMPQGVPRFLRLLLP